MQNQINEGTTLEWTNGTGGDIASGKLVVIGSIVGVAMGIIKNGATGVVNVRPGIVEMGKTAALAITQGDKLYINAGTGLVTKTNTDTFVGYAAKAEIGASATVQVLWCQEGK